MGSQDPQVQTTTTAIFFSPPTKFQNVSNSALPNNLDHGVQHGRILGNVSNTQVQVAHLQCRNNFVAFYQGSTEWLLHINMAASLRARHEHFVMLVDPP